MLVGDLDYDDNSSYNNRQGNSGSSGLGGMMGSSNSNSNSHGNKKSGDFTDKVVDGVANYAKKQW
jgi:hypothetical protein